MQASSGKVVISLLDYSGKSLYSWSPTYDLPAFGSMSIYNDSLKAMMSQGGTFALFVVLKRVRGEARK